MTPGNMGITDEAVEDKAKDIQANTTSTASDFKPDTTVDDVGSEAGNNGFVTIDSVTP